MSEEPQPQEPIEKCPVCYGRGYEHCDCWPGDCICSEGDRDCEACFGSGIKDWEYPDGY